MHDWLEHDGEPAPPDAPDGVALDATGVSLIAKRKRTRAEWSDVLGVARVDDRIFVLVPRRPPHPPWIEIDAAAQERDAAEIASEIARRIEGNAYRSASRPTRPMLEPRELLSRIMGREEVPGAVEIPVPSLDTAGRRTVEALGGGAYAGIVGAQLGGWLGVVLGASPHVSLLVAAAITGGAFASWRAFRPRRRLPRVLVLCPDGCIAGFSDGVRVMAWREIARIEVGTVRTTERVPRTVSAVVVHGTDGVRMGHIEARWMDAPLELVVAVANAYRARWSRAAE